MSKHYICHCKPCPTDLLRLYRPAPLRSFIDRKTGREFRPFVYTPLGIYLGCNDGNIYYQNHKTGEVKVLKLRDHVTPADKERKRRNEYLQLTMSLNGKHHDALVHRIIYLLFIGPLIPGLQIDHINGNKLDNRPENLEQVTQSENIRRANAMRRINNLLAEGKVDEARLAIVAEEQRKSHMRDSPHCEKTTN